MSKCPVLKGHEHFSKAKENLYEKERVINIGHVYGVSIWKWNYC